MKINISWMFEENIIREDTTVAIDVYAATTNIALMLAKKPKHLIIVNEDNLERAKSVYLDYILIGESKSLDKQSFDVRNNPSVIDNTDIYNKNVLYMSINGTRLLEKYVNDSKKLITCSLSNLDSVSSYIKNELSVHIVLSGSDGKKVLEDEICSRLLIKTVNNEEYDWNDYKQKVVKFISTFVDYQDSVNNQDYSYITDLNKYDMVPRCFNNASGFPEIKDQQ